MAVEVVVFDVGETLIDETGMWTRAAEVAGVTPFTLMGVLGGRSRRAATTPSSGSTSVSSPRPRRGSDDDWYPDALPCVERLRDAGYRVCAVGNTPRFVEEEIGRRLEVLGSSESWGVAKPDPAFFARIVEARRRRA